MYFIFTSTIRQRLYSVREKIGIKHYQFTMKCYHCLSDFVFNQNLDKQNPDNTFSFTGFCKTTSDIREDFSSNILKLSLIYLNEAEKKILNCLSKYSKSIVTVDWG